MNGHEKLVAWLVERVVADARGDNADRLNVLPSGRFWLGRLAPEAKVMANPMGDRGERLDPCATGLRLLAKTTAQVATISVSMRVWKRLAAEEWVKLPLINYSTEVTLGGEEFTRTVGGRELEDSLAAIGAPGMSARLEISWEHREPGIGELAVQLVNGSPEKIAGLDTNIYECRIKVTGVSALPFKIEALPDSFRYDREVPAYGINCGVIVGTEGAFETTDLPTVDKSRPNFWGAESTKPDFSFSRLSEDPVTAGQELVAALLQWGELHWCEPVLAQRAEQEGWSKSMLGESNAGAIAFREECDRISAGVSLMMQEPTLLACFCGMNRAISRSARGKYDSWRPFQFGFLLANLAALIDEKNEREIADVVWFSTGGGKTETYLGLLVTAALFDRARGKRSGITAWSRFPLRMLSLQQTQRFADALGAAEIERREMNLGGDPFSLGFFVGKDSTPNKVTEEDVDDLGNAERFRVIDRCPFCSAPGLQMYFDRRTWRLQHICNQVGCPSGRVLPLYIVDDEIYRFLPTIVVGTLDKAASISMQAAMRGFVGAPRARCTRESHGYTYALRSGRANGCLVPGCNASTEFIGQDERLFAPTFRLQDELHLLRDSLGAIDAHYEALYDDLQQSTGSASAKVVASSATLAGYEEQVNVLYRRNARVFPCPPPHVSAGFWAKDTDELMRRYVAVAPRGVTIDFAVDRILTVLQHLVRELLQQPEYWARRIGVPIEQINDLTDKYGTNVVYGNTLRDLEAVSRSAETQILVSGGLNTASLTGKTGFEEVRTTLSRLQNPETAFEDRVHIVTASAMMSHGVDIDRLNVMVMLGLPLATAEFIQATARVGRTFPGLVFVMHKIGRERDAAIYRSFTQYVLQGDRFLEPIPITRQSRRVLERTIAGLALARILMLHEPRAGSGITTPGKLRQLLDDGRYVIAEEIQAIVTMLQLNTGEDDGLIQDVKNWFELWEENIRSPAPDGRFLSQNAPGGRGPMMSLRDVDTQVSIWGRRF